MIFKNKKGAIFFTLMLSMFILVFMGTIYFGAQGALNNGNINEQFGQKQLELFKTYGKGENLLFYLDESSQLALSESIKEFALAGGHKDQLSDLNKIGHNFWNYEGQEYYPESYNEGFEEVFKKVLREYTSSNLYLPDDYIISVKSTNPISIYGSSTDSIELAVTSETNHNVEITSDFKMVGDEKYYECKSGACIAEVAKHYATLYDDLPYIWGGESPYTYSDTMFDKKNNPDSIFKYVGVTRLQPSRKGYDPALTLPGFDCSGFTWWVLRHSQIPKFRGRFTAEGYRNTFIGFLGKRTKEVCNYDCTKDKVLTQAEKGDILIYGRYDSEKKKDVMTHIAIYAGDGEIFESTSSRAAGPKGGLVRRKIPDKFFNSRTTIKSIYRITKFEN